MITDLHRVEHRARVWGQLMATGCDGRTSDDVFDAVARTLPGDDPIVLRQLLRGCIAVTSHVNVQLYRKPRAAFAEELAKDIAGVSSERIPKRERSAASSLMQMWIYSYVERDLSALRRWVSIIEPSMSLVRRRTLATMMLLHMRGDIDQMSPKGREILAATFLSAPLCSDPHAHILSALWAEGCLHGAFPYQQRVLQRLREAPRRVRADTLWVCARTVAAGLRPGDDLEEEIYNDPGCQCETGAQSAILLCTWIRRIGQGTPGMAAYVRKQYHLYANRDTDTSEDTSDHLLLAGASWLARRFMT